ncbi:TetR/AcrR family transcriptional regulator [Agromyces sp. SYSU K20354]|uniref:TetR/AcrR family transcriptional regulator n=1 Tax=Agromyces cavernae TaxID=2898659 RepID=UPI001E4C57A9|nr:TetR/AcrR family transcriptional regulator [Agromyces cavernae]MCD2443595.1 TetR/AcrR family transcriptional regulator [Agromyces cavernae]
MSEPIDLDRPRRSDGEQTYAAILDTAVRLASVEGLGGLSIGRLAQQVGVSKSGLYAHFRSKRRLQLDIIRQARAIFEREVIAPAFEAPEGIRRLESLCEAYLSYVERRVFPGGCFFAGMMAEFDAQSGSAHDEAAADQREWIGLIDGAARRAQALGELATDADIAQLAFDLTAAVEHANYYSVLFGDTAVVGRARVAIAAAIARARPAEGREP